MDGGARKYWDAMTAVVVVMKVEMIVEKPEVAAMGVGAAHVPHVHSDKSQHCMFWAAVCLRQGPAGFRVVQNEEGSVVCHQQRQITVDEAP